MSQQTAEFDACALLPAAKLSTITGSEVGVGRQMPAGGWVAGQCAWSAGALGFELSVGTAATITSFGESGIPDAKAKLGAYRAQAVGAGVTAKDVSGIGDGAVITPNGMASYKGDTYLELQNLGLNDDQVAAIMRLVVEAL